MPSNHATGDWPKQYLLNLYNSAIDNGYIWVNDLTYERSRSLRGAFNRLRRRGDTSMAGIITPEMTLVSMGQWVPTHGDLGKVPIIYNALPDGLPLPSITTGGDRPVAPLAHVAEPLADLPLPAPDTDLTQLMNNADLTVNEADISSYVQQMLAKTKEHGDA